MPLDNAAANPQSVADAGNYQSSIDQAIKQTNAAPSPTPRPVARMTPTAQSYFQQAQQGIEEERQYRAEHPLRSVEQSLWQGKPPEFDAAQAFGSTASVMGILLGALTRAPLTASLNASAAAMTALRQNDLMKYKEAKDTWEKNTELAMNNAKAYNEQVLKGLELMKSDHAAGLSAIQTAAAINKDDVLMGIQSAESAQRMLIARQQATDAHDANVLRLSNEHAAWDRAEEEARKTHPELFAPLPKGAPEQQQADYKRKQMAAVGEAQAKFESEAKAAAFRGSAEMQAFSLWQANNPGKSYEDFLRAKERSKQQGKIAAAEVPSVTEEEFVPNSGGLTRQALEQTSTEYNLNGGKISNPPRGPLAQIQMNAIRNRAAQQAAEIGLTPEVIASLPAERKANTAALLQDIRYQDGVKNGLYLFDNMFDVAGEYAKKINLTEIQKINSLILTGQTEFGDPYYNNYANAMATIALEYGRLTGGPTSNAMAPVELMKIGMARLGPQITPSQFEGEKELIKKEAKAKLDALDRTIAERKGIIQQPISANVGAVAAPAAPATATMPTFVDEKAAQDAFSKGQIQQGQSIIVGGQQGVWR
jgi:hypothetical protein